MSKERGVSYLEMMVVLVVLGSMTAVGLRAMDRLIEQSSARSLITVVLALTNEARTLAILRHTYAGIAFEDTARGVEARVYRDGDADGLSAQDVARGVDTPEGPAFTLKEERARVGLPAAVTTDPSGLPLTGSRGVRFGNGNFLSFGPAGTATPGSLYLACGEREAWAFRVAPLSGRIRVFQWRSGRWFEVERH
jgi:Tfp pilus assembly protein FimT